MSLVVDIILWSISQIITNWYTWLAHTDKARRCHHTPPLPLADYVSKYVSLVRKKQCDIIPKDIPDLIQPNPASYGQGQIKRTPSWTENYRWTLCLVHFIIRRASDDTGGYVVHFVSKPRNRILSVRTPYISPDELVCYLFQLILCVRHYPPRRATFCYCHWEHPPERCGNLHNKLGLYQ